LNSDYFLIDKVARRIYPIEVSYYSENSVENKLKATNKEEFVAILKKMIQVPYISRIINKNLIQIQTEKELKQS
jgi:hypothetical protein